MSLYKGTTKVLSQNKKVIETSLKLNSNNTMPVMGLGTYKITGSQIIETVLDSALKAGYRSFDTAAVYRNEKDIGNSLKRLLPKYNLKREDIFITTKLAPSDQGKADEAVKESLNNLGLTYIDLYLIHWPGAQGTQPNSPLNAQLRAKSWAQLEALYNQKVLRAIGVSNYTKKHLDELLSKCKIKPALNQVEFNIHYRHPKELLDLCGNHEILLQSYATFGGSGYKSILNDEKVLSIAKKLNVTPAQLMLRWCLQEGFGIIPKSVSDARIVENVQIDFIISNELMDEINSISKRGKTSWDPEIIM